MRNSNSEISIFYTPTLLLVLNSASSSTVVFPKCSMFSLVSLYLKAQRVPEARGYLCIMWLA